MEVQPDNAAKQELIAAIIEHALEGLGSWRPPTPKRGIGPAYPALYKGFQDRLKVLRADLSKRLDRFGIEELRRDFPPSTTPRFNQLFDRNGRHYDLAGRLADLKASVPANYVGGWATAEKEIDLKFWRGHARYSLKDATLLSVGRDPRNTNYNSVFKGYGKSAEADDVLYFLEDFYERIAAGFRLDPDNQDAQVGAADFFEWVKNHQVQIDPRFRRMLKEQFPRASGLPKPPSETATRTEHKLHGSTKYVLTRVILAVAMTKYELDDERKIGKVARAMQSDGDLHGLSFDSETVRKLLRAEWSQLRKARQD